MWKTSPFTGRTSVPTVTISKAHERETESEERTRMRSPAASRPLSGFAGQFDVAIRHPEPRGGVRDIPEFHVAPASGRRDNAAVVDDHEFVVSRHGELGIGRAPMREALTCRSSIAVFVVSILIALFLIVTLNPSARISPVFVLVSGPGDVR